MLLLKLVLLECSSSQQILPTNSFPSQVYPKGNLIYDALNGNYTPDLKDYDTVEELDQAEKILNESIPKYPGNNGVYDSSEIRNTESSKETEQNLFGKNYDDTKYLMYNDYENDYGLESNSKIPDEDVIGDINMSIRNKDNLVEKNAENSSRKKIENEKSTDSKPFLKGYLEKLVMALENLKVKTEKQKTGIDNIREIYEKHYDEYELLFNKIDKNMKFTQLSEYSSDVISERHFAPQEKILEMKKNKNDLSFVELKLSDAIFESNKLNKIKNCFDLDPCKIEFIPDSGVLCYMNNSDTKLLYPCFSHYFASVIEQITETIMDISKFLTPINDNIISIKNYGNKIEDTIRGVDNYFETTIMIYDELEKNKSFKGMNSIDKSVYIPRYSIEEKRMFRSLINNSGVYHNTIVFILNGFFKEIFDDISYFTENSDDIYTNFVNMKISFYYNPVIKFNPASFLLKMYSHDENLKKIFTIMEDSKPLHDFTPFKNSINHLSDGIYHLFSYINGINNELTKNQTFESSFSKKILRMRESDRVWIKDSPKSPFNDKIDLIYQKITEENQRIKDIIEQTPEELAKIPIVLKSDFNAENEDEATVSDQEDPVKDDDHENLPYDDNYASRENDLPVSKNIQEKTEIFDFIQQPETILFCVGAILLCLISGLSNIY